MARPPKENDNKIKAVKRLKARGFAHIDNTATGVILGLVDSAGFFQKVRVDRNGTIHRYKAIKARQVHKQRLPHIQGELKTTKNGNFV